MNLSLFYNWLHEAKSFFRNHHSLSYSTVFKYFIERQGSLRYSQEPSTGLYSEPDESSHISLRSILILSSHICLGLILFFPAKTLYSPSPHACYMSCQYNVFILYESVLYVSLTSLLYGMKMKILIAFVRGNVSSKWTRSTSRPLNCSLLLSGVVLQYEEGTETYCWAALVWQSISQSVNFWSVLLRLTC
jgi:hypothetical protein